MWRLVCLSWQATNDDVDVKSKALTNLEAVTSLSSDDMELKKHEQVILEMQSSPRPDTWMGIA